MRRVAVPQLRSYQLDLLRQVQDALAADVKARVMMQLPTGGGKTIIAGALLSEWLTAGRKAVWLTHRRELAEQTCRMLTDAGISALADVDWRPGTDAPAMSRGAVISMAQTVGRRAARRGVWSRYDPNDLMVIDEAPHAAAGSWERAMEQWPGRIVGMTATPWRLSKNEGFDHLFGELFSGPQIADLQVDGWLCRTRTLLPPPERCIIGGAVDRTGDYNESGIELANRDRPHVMTAGALEFWREHAGGRSTIVYAVSVNHARHLTNVFNDADIPAAVVLGGARHEERDDAIVRFRDGAVKVLVNVIVATEGFDLPDASCIVIARPTMSLALYLQMAGRGLRPKDGDGDCLLLDLAANSVAHGLPEECRQWSIEPRGPQPPGGTPVVRCPACGTASPAANHDCRRCGHAFGKDCPRCGRWRARKRWQFRDHCGDVHQLVCDLCHIDAHIQAHLPVAEPLDKLLDLYDPEDGMSVARDAEMGDELTVNLAAALKVLLETERRNVAGVDDERRNDLRREIERRGAILSNDDALHELFENHIINLPEAERPTSNPQKYRMYGDWEKSHTDRVDELKRELSELEGHPVDKQAIFGSARNKVMRLLQREARSVGLLPEGELSPLKQSSDDSNVAGIGEGRKMKKRFKQLEDHIIPVLQLMKKGTSHTKAFKMVAEKLGVRPGSVRDRCTRGLDGGNTGGFVESVRNGGIIHILKAKFPRQVELIERELQ